MCILANMLNIIRRGFLNLPLLYRFERFLDPTVQRLCILAIKLFLISMIEFARLLKSIMKLNIPNMSYQRTGKLPRSGLIFQK